MARLKDLAVCRGGDTFLFDPEKIKEIPGYNARDMDSEETKAHIRKMADAIHAGGTVNFPPITVGQKDGEIFLYAGYCRRRAFLLAKQEGAPIKGILAIANNQKEDERVLDLLNSNDGLPLTPLEKANVVKRLLSFGWTAAEISKRRGVSLGTINNLIALLDAPGEIKEMVKSGEVSATLAVNTIRSEKEDAADKLNDAIEVAKANGKKKATVKHLKEIPDAPCTKAEFFELLWDVYESDKYNIDNNFLRFAEYLAYVEEYGLPKR